MCTKVCMLSFVVKQGVTGDESQGSGAGALVHRCNSTVRGHSSPSTNSLLRQPDL